MYIPFNVYFFLTTHKSELFGKWCPSSFPHKFIVNLLRNINAYIRYHLHAELRKFIFCRFFFFLQLMFTESRGGIETKKYSDSLIVKQDLVFLNTWGYKKIGHLRGKWSWPPSDAQCWPLLSKTTYHQKQGKKEYCLQESSRPNGLKWSMGGYYSCKYGQYLTFSGVEF